ncbi:MAG: hypothetical protein GC151_16970 [Betaproteobacteria bacterium]|nr:hypothetical protein [Betaproteobacteria bacterium]
MIARLCHTCLLAVATVVLLAGGVPRAEGQGEAGFDARDRGQYGVAIREFERAATRGDPRAAAALAEMYEKGLGTRRDHDAAVKWRVRAAEAGDAESAYIVGNLHARGDGVDRDDAAARHWYRIAARQGHAQAQLELSKLLGSTASPDDEAREAGLWYRRALEAGADLVPAVPPRPAPDPGTVEPPVTQTGATIDLATLRRLRARYARLSALLDARDRGQRSFRGTLWLPFLAAGRVPDGGPVLLLTLPLRPGVE